MVIGMAFAAFVLHYLNGLRLEQHEAAAADLERRRRALEHNGGRKTEARRQELVSHKREQLELWAARAAAGDAIAVARVERLRADIARLQEIPEADADTDAEAA
ncbi:hypothetical protein M885DRAFT_515209 [Pelagophyceae sp. CCMP2097]|nr:hypothetical protein M885DRAFT_515209 [Pelagophyceae sp. CCMP2097]